MLIKKRRGSDNRQVYSLSEWESFGETMRGNGRSPNGGLCTGCSGTGLKLSTASDGENMWRGCEECADNAVLYCVE